MSYWTYIKGVVTVEPAGANKNVKDFVLNEVLDHLPRVTGSEGPMSVMVTQKPDFNSSSNHDEFGQYSNLGEHHPHRGRGWFECRSEYDIVLDGALRDRMFDQTLREFSAWMSRLSKRVYIEDVLVRVWTYDQKVLFDDPRPWADMFDDWSWVRSDEPAYAQRRSTNWRYGIMPEVDGNWVENLFTLLPVGNRVAEELDFAAGNLEWYEYGQGADDVADSLSELRGMTNRFDETATALKDLMRSL